MLSLEKNLSTGVHNGNRAHRYSRYIVQVKLVWHDEPNHPVIDLYVFQENHLPKFTLLLNS